MCLDIFLKIFGDALQLNRFIVSVSQSTSGLSQVSIKNVKCYFERVGFHVSNSWMCLSRFFTIKEVMLKSQRFVVVR
jgi:hypothetical protein